MPEQAVTVNAAFKATVEGDIASVDIGDMPEYVAIPSKNNKMITVPIVVKDEYGGVVSGVDTDLTLKDDYNGVSVSGDMLVIDSTATEVRSLLLHHTMLSAEKKQ